VIDTAKEMIGRIKNIGTHAAALIITDRNLFGNIPLAKVGSKGAWTSMWTEGRNAQLSKFGYVKWDWLGLKTLDYVFKSCKLICENRGISFGDKIEGWADIDPENNKAGYFIDANGTKHIITLDDEEVFKLVNVQKTDAIFQFDTDLAKSTLQNRVQSFQDLMLLNAMGHPGPLDSIPEAMENRNNPNNGWQKALHPDILFILKDTYGVIVYQEQLAAIWMKLGGFTAPEAQEARKAVAKKWTHKLKPIRDKWMNGATESLGADQANQWWDKMVSFGRYAFNKSHAVAYCLMAYRCLWLKAHFAPEYWAAVLSGCHPDKLERYISVAKSEGWIPTSITKLGTVQDEEGLALGSLNIDDLRNEFGVHRNTITQGLIGVKGIGEKVAEIYAGKGTYNHIDEFISTAERRNKTAIERFIKLGAFKHLPNHHNSKALYYYYLFNHSTSSNDAKKDKDSIMQALAIKQGWTEQSIKQEQARQKEEYRKLYPKRLKLPAKIDKWKPNIMIELNNFNETFENDFTLDERLSFQKEYLGYWLESPLTKYKLEGGRTIEEARNAGKHDSRVELEVVVIDVVSAKTKTDKPYHKLIVSDGTQQTSIFLWPAEKILQRQEYLTPGQGLKIPTNYNADIKLFSVRKNSLISKLRVRDEIKN
jgi:DNA polymerase III alpha subunit